MARTVDTTSTFEDWRQNYNDLANDVGGLADLRTGVKSTVVDAINYIQDQYFFFQDYDFDGSDGATSNTVFSGNDNAGVLLEYNVNKLLVFKNGALLRKGTDYTATNGTSVVLGSSANNGDVIRISSFTGSYEGVSGAGENAGNDNWQLSGGVLFNNNQDGIIFNADSTINNSLEHANSIQFENIAYFKDEVFMKSVGSAPTGINFQDADNSHRVQLKAPTTISSNFSLILPTGDGSDGQFLKTDGSGNLSFATVTSTAPDVNVTANNSANETVFPVFVDGATGTQGIESDTGFTYNPSSGTLTSTTFAGALTGNASGSAATLASSRNFSISGDITANAVGFNGSSNVVLSATIDDNVVDAAALYVSGNGSAGQILASDGDGSFSWTSDGGLTTEAVEDIVGAMFTGNTETGITVTYQDSTNDIDLVIGSNAIVQSMMADNSINSENYVDGSIDAEHIASNAVTTAKIADGNITVGKMAANSVDSAQYVNASIDAEHIANNTITATQIAANAVGTSELADDSVTLANMAGLARGKIIVGDASGNPVALALGSSGTVLKSDGTDLAFAADSGLSTEQVQDIVGSMFSSNTETRVTATYQDGDGTIDLVVDDMTANDNTQLSTEAVQDIVGAMFSSNTETRVTATYQDGDGTIDLVVDDMTANTQLSTAQVRAQVSAGTNISYNSSTGVITGSTQTANDFTNTLKSKLDGIAASATANTGDITAVVAGAGLDGGATSGSATLSIESDVREHANQYFGGSGGEFTLYDGSNNLYRMYVNNSEMAQLDSSGNLDVENDVIAFSSSVASDERLKENIKPIDNALDTLMKLDGVTFDWKKDGKNSMGLIAQEVEKHIPYLVEDRKMINSDEMSKKLNYNGLIGLLLQSIKELKTELDDLKSSKT